MKKRFRAGAILSACIVAAASLTSCATFDTFKSEFFPKDANATDTVKIGVFEPLSGADGRSGELERMGIELAHELYPECMGKEVELIYADSRSDMDAAEEAIQELIAQNPAIVLGSYGSAYSLAAAGYLEEAKIPAIAATNTNPLVTQNNPYYFSLSFSDTYQGAVMGKYAVEVMNVSKAGIMRKANDDSAIPVSLSFEEKIVQMTGDQSAVTLVEYASDLSDISKKLTELKKAGINTVFLPVGSEEAAKILKAAQKIDQSFVFLGSSDWETDAFISQAGDAAGMAVISTIYDSEAGVNSMSEVFLKAYRAKYGEDAVPESAVALAFDSYLIAIESLNRVGTVKDGDLLRQSLCLVSKFEGASGNITFDAAGNTIKTVVIKGVKNQSFTNIYTIEPNVV